MSLHRRNPRRDANEKVIVDALEAQGFNVVRLSGTGVPDLVITKGGRNWFCEVKTAKGKYKPAQIAFYQRWTGPAILTLRTVEDAMHVQLLAVASDVSRTPQKNDDLGLPGCPTTKGV